MTPGIGRVADGGGSLSVTSARIRFTSVADDGRSGAGATLSFTSA
jgi:hypothetical protein